MSSQVSDVANYTFDYTKYAYALGRITVVTFRVYSAV